MHSQRYNHLIIQKTNQRGDANSLLRGCYSSNRKAEKSFLALKDEEVSRLARFTNREPLCTQDDNRITITVAGFQTTLFLLKIPQDVNIANTI